MVGSRRSFLVYIAAILCYEPVLAQPLGFIHGFASAIEQSAVQRTVSIPNFRYAVFVLKFRVAFLTGHQVKLFHLCMSSMALAEQIFTIDKSRILKYLGHLAPEDMQRLDYALKNSLALNPLGSIRKLKPIIRSTAAYAPPEVVDGKPPIYPYTPIKSSFEDAGSVEEMMLYTELQSAVHAMIQRLEYSFTFNPSLLTIPKRKQQVSEILAEAEKYIWRIREEMQCD